MTGNGLTLLEALAFLGCMLIVAAGATYILVVTVPRRQRAAIIADVESRGAKVRDVRVKPHFSLFGSSIKWKVALVFANGTEVSAVAKASSFPDRVKWLDGPFA